MQVTERTALPAVSTVDLFASQPAPRWINPRHDAGVEKKLLQSTGPDEALRWSGCTTARPPLRPNFWECWSRCNTRI